MSARIAALVKDLKALRTGLGIEDRRLVAKAGEMIRTVSGVTREDSPAVVRRKIKSWLESVLPQLPEATAQIGRAVFGLAGPGDQSYLARLEALGKTMQREVRSMQRYADHMIYRLAETAVDGVIPADSADQPWHTTQVRVDLVLDQPAVEVLETRRIVSHVKGLSEIEHWLSIPPVDQPPHPLDLASLGVDVLSGGELRSPPRLVSSSRVALVLRPPEPLNAGAEHEFFFRVRIPVLSPFYVCTPRFACDEFLLRIRFGRDRIPERIWRIDGELPMEAGDPFPSRQELRADSLGEVRTTFVDLRPATSYGIGWQP